MPFRTRQQPRVPQYLRYILQRISAVYAQSAGGLGGRQLLRGVQAMRTFFLERLVGKRAQYALMDPVAPEHKLSDPAALGLSRLILDAISCTLVVMDKNGHIIMVNRAWEKFGAENGASSSLIAGIGLNYFDVCHRSAASGMTQLDGMLSVLQGERQEFTCLYPCHSPTEKRWMKMQAISLGGDGQALMVRHTNVTDAYLTQDVLQRMTQAVEQSPESVVIVGGDGAIEYSNSGFHKLSGYPAADMFGRNYLVWRTAHLASAAPQEMLMAFVGSASWSGELLCMHSSGEYYWEHVSLWPIQDYLDQDSKPGFVVFSRNITEQKRTQKEFQDSKQALRELYASVLNVREEERRSIARDLHDDMGQALTALRMDVHQLKNSQVGVAAAWPSRLSNMLTIVNQNIDLVRRVCENLRPGMLDVLGLAAAIEYHVTEYSKNSEIHCVLEMNREEFSADELTAITLFRIVQELLTNVTRHAQASEVKIVLHESADFIRLQVTDNGVGMPEPSQNPNKHRHFGLLGISERVKALSGSMLIERSTSGGVCVRISLPLVLRREHDQCSTGR